MEYDRLTDNPSASKRPKVFFLLASVLALVVAFVIGLLIGEFAIQRVPTISDANADAYGRPPNAAVSGLLMKEFQSDNIKAHLAVITKCWHLAGTDCGRGVADYIRDRWVEFGLDHVEQAEYNVLLSYPNVTRPNTVHFQFKSNGSVASEISNGLSTFMLAAERESAHANIQWNAYAHAGNVTADKVVYANYGRIEDLDYLVNNLTMNLTNTLLVIRYGMLWRGAKVLNAQNYGAAGVLFYPDPFDYANKSSDPRNISFPHNVYMPQNATQRGTVENSDMGDPLTPLLPAKDYTSRVTIDSLYQDKIIPRIPVTPISYSSATKLLGAMGGSKAPGAWRGSLNVPYNVGPNLTNADLQVKFECNVQPKRVNITNTIGYIRGTVEPDKYVLVGNHHDAWVYGAVDPSSGTATMLEMGRTIRSIMNSTNWRPRRTLVFCSWDAEEYGLVGSAEWVQEYLHLLQARSVGYLNVDIAVSVVEPKNMNFQGTAGPLLHRLMFNATKAVPNPADKSGDTTVYDNWLAWARDNATGVPKVQLPGSGSDHYHFLDYVGTPVTVMTYGGDSAGSYPLYHTLHETPFLYNNLSDTHYAHARAVGQVWVEMLRNMADSVLLPFSVDLYGEKMVGYVADLKTYVKKDLDLTDLAKAADIFKTSAAAFHARLGKALATNHSIELRSINEILAKLEQCFLEPSGIPQRPTARHVIFAPSKLNSYAGVTFAGVRDSLAQYRQRNNTNVDVDPAGVDWLATAKYQVSWAAYSIYAAVDLMSREI